MTGKKSVEQVSRYGKYMRTDPEPNHFGHSYFFIFSLIIDIFLIYLSSFKITGSVFEIKKDTPMEEKK